MNVNEISVIRQIDYDESGVYEAVKRLLEPLGGIGSFVKSGQSVFVKANLVRELPPESAATTHPAVIGAVMKLIAEAGGKATVGDSSGGVYSEAHMNGVYKTTGMLGAAERSGGKVNDDYGSSCVSNEKGAVLKRIDVTDSFLKADVVINCCKLKTHGLTAYSGAVKNLFGLIPGLVKVEMHSKYNTLDSFTDCLIDIERFASEKIALHIIDGIVGMEGAGPTNGRPRKMNVLIASRNPYAADIAAISIFDEPLENPIIIKAVGREIISPDDEFLSAVKAKTAPFFIGDFDKINAKLPPSFFANMPGFIAKLFRSGMSRRVKIRKKICVGCGKCKTHCPGKAIEIKNRKAHIDQSKCIRCYCCQELCPRDAVAFNKPLLYGLVNRLSGRK